MIHCFNPWTDENTRILIIGTMPSAASLAQNMYYAHPYNKFWPYMCTILNNGILPLTADERRRMLNRNGIGLWDSLAACERDGSLDADIKNARPNDFRSYKQIRFFLFNGQKAFQYFKKHNADLLQNEPANYLVLPSTSPANASIGNETKFQLWQHGVQTALQA